MAHFAGRTQWEIAAKIFYCRGFAGSKLKSSCKCRGVAYYSASLLGDRWALILESEGKQCAVVTY
jgi:hypothetical protein